MTNTMKNWAALGLCVLAMLLTFAGLWLLIDPTVDVVVGLLYPNLTLISLMGPVAGVVAWLTVFGVGYGMFHLFLKLGWWDA